MKIKKKLDYLTLENFLSYYSDNNCINKTNCSNCPFRFTNCDPNSENFWLKNKDVFSDDFLYQEIEFDVKNILTNEEKEYLRNVIKPFRNDIDYIHKDLGSYEEEYICIEMYCHSIEKSCHAICLPPFPRNSMYKNMEDGCCYTLEQLEL